MDQETNDQWFYTCKGERLGPSSLADLKAKVDNKEIDPIADLVWKKGMPEWRPAGEMTELYGKEAKSSPPPPTPQPPPKPKPPAIQQAPVKETPRTAKDIKWPGARRLSFLFMVFIFPIVWSWGFQNVIGAFGHMLGSATALDIVTLVGTFIPALFILLYTLQRLSNIGMSRWWIIGYIVPLLNLWIGYRCFATPAGYSSHGKLGGIGWMLAIFYWVSTIVAIVAFIAVAAGTFLILTDQTFIDEMMKTLENNPELQESFEDIVDHIKNTVPEESAVEP